MKIGLILKFFSLLFVFHEGHSKTIEQPTVLLQPPECSYLRYNVAEQSSAIEIDSKLCCLCPKGTYWFGECNDSDATTTQCKTCTFNSESRTYIDYEPHNKKKCILDEQCMSPKIAVGGSASQRSRCECPPGTYEVDRHCELVPSSPYNSTDTLRKPQTYTSIPSTIATEKKTSSSSVTSSEVPFTRPSSHVEQVTDKDSTGEKDGSSNIWWIVIIIIGVFLLLFFCLYKKLKWKCVFGVDRVKEDAQSESPGTQSRRTLISSDSSNSVRTEGASVQDENEEITELIMCTDVPEQNGAFPINDEVIEQENQELHVLYVPPRQIVNDERQQRDNPGISRTEKEKVKEALEEMSQKTNLVRRDVQKLSHLLLKDDETYIDDMDGKYTDNTPEFARTIFNRAVQKDPNLTLQQLRGYVKDLGYLRDIVDQKIQET